MRFTFLAHVMFGTAHAFRSVCLNSPPMSLEAGVSNLSATFEPSHPNSDVFMRSANILSELSHHIERDVKLRSNSTIRRLSLFTSTSPLAIVAANKLPRSFFQRDWPMAPLTFFGPCPVHPFKILLANKSKRQCAGLSPYCSRAVITGGASDPDLALEWEGQVGCIEELVQTSTTLITKKMSTGTLTETILSYFTLTTTDYFTSMLTSTSTSPAFPSPGFWDPGPHPSDSLAFSTSGPGMPAVSSQASGAPSSGTVPFSTGLSSEASASTLPPSTTSFSTALISHTPDSVALANVPSEVVSSQMPTLTPTNGVFESSAARSLPSLTATVTVSLVSTFTLLQTISGCTLGSIAPSM